MSGPLHTTEYILKNNKLIINFFAVKPDGDYTDGVYIGEKELLIFIEDKLKEL